ncbi:hypothetical protein BD309DRAFT_689262 [Dichomitus squalens]|nr:hypothetical protein BD309DRAFT_689262 [Dichomitus squalens]
MQSSSPRSRTVCSLVLPSSVTATQVSIRWEYCLYSVLDTQTIPIQPILSVLASMGSRQAAGNFRTCSSYLVPLACDEVSYRRSFSECTAPRLAIAYLYIRHNALVVCPPSSCLPHHLYPSVMLFVRYLSEYPNFASQ